MTRYMTTASISAALLDAHSSFIKLIPPKRKAALTTPIKAPPAIKPEASNVPFSKRAEFKALVFATASYVPTDRSTDQKRRIQVQRNKHTQGECQRRYLAEVQYDGEDGSNCV